MQFLFYPHALLIALISRTAQYTDTVSCGNVQPKAVCTRKCADVLWSGLRVQYSACPLFLTPGGDSPSGRENIFPDMLPAGFCFILAQSVRFYHLVLHLLLSSPSLYFTPRASAVALF